MMMADAPTSTDSLPPSTDPFNPPSASQSGYGATMNNENATTNSMPTPGMTFKPNGPAYSLPNAQSAPASAENASAPSANTLQAHPPPSEPPLLSSQPSPSSSFAASREEDSQPTARGERTRSSPRHNRYTADAPENGAGFASPFAKQQQESFGFDSPYSDYQSFHPEDHEGLAAASAAAGQLLSASKWQWTDQADDLLIHLIQSEVGRKTFDTHRFRRKSWSALQVRMAQEVGCPLNKTQIRSRIALLRKHYAIIEAMKATPGFVWDPVTCSVDAPADVFAEYSEIHRESRRFKARPFPFYQRLKVLFGDPSRFNHQSSPLMSGGHEMTTTMAKGISDASFTQQALPLSQAYQRNVSFGGHHDVHSLPLSRSLSPSSSSQHDSNKRVKFDHDYASQPGSLSSNLPVPSEHPSLSSMHTNGGGSLSVNDLTNVNHTSKNIGHLSSAIEAFAQNVHPPSTQPAVLHVNNGTSSSFGVPVTNDTASIAAVQDTQDPAQVLKDGLEALLGERGLLNATRAERAALRTQIHAARLELESLKFLILETRDEYDVVTKELDSLHSKYADVLCNLGASLNVQNSTVHSNFNVEHAQAAEPANVSGSDGASPEAPLSKVESTPLQDSSSASGAQSSAPASLETSTSPSHAAIPASADQEPMDTSASSVKPVAEGTHAAVP